MDDRLPLSSLLSQTLVAFTIEFDNEFEHRVPHRTTNHGATARPAPWLVSMVMWLMLLRYVPDGGISVRELQLLTRLGKKELRLWLTRFFKWWGYVVVEAEKGADGAKRSAADWLVRPTIGGAKALQAWRPLTGVIEKRWEQRFGDRLIKQLRESLRALVAALPGDLLDYLPILSYGMFSIDPRGEQRVGAGATPASEAEHTLPILLAKALLAFATEFERDSGLSLAISANVLRLIGPDGVRVRDFPRLSGVSKEAIAMALGYLQKRGLAAVRAKSSAKKEKLVVLTADGRRAQNTYRETLAAIERRWHASFPPNVLGSLRDSLETLAGRAAMQASPLLQGLQPYPNGWRAAVRNIEVLPHFPMVLHRGGFPDGS
jgi:DNA-binding MarR family transcriptional regulator